MDVGDIVQVVLPVGVQASCTVPVNKVEGTSVTVKVAGVPFVTGTVVSDGVIVTAAPVVPPEPLTLPAPLPVPCNVIAGKEAPLPVTMARVPLRVPGATGVKVT